ncbi:MAG: carboxypeptidase regulatory-like domain-containing protein [Caldilineaceae bacterium]|nr:carboxypeptidase regulatory-like domain-containing protein [Caldilineaceae bacterium]
MTHILAVLALAAALLAPAAPGPGSVAGTIYFDPLHPGSVAALGLPPMAGWPVRLCQDDDCRDAATDAAGTFIFSGLEYGKYQVRIETGAGLFTQDAELNEAGAAVSIDVSVMGWSTFLPMTAKGE